MHLQISFFTFLDKQGEGIISGILSLCPGEIPAPGFQVRLVKGVTFWAHLYEYRVESRGLSGVEQVSYGRRDTRVQSNQLQYRC